MITSSIWLPAALFAGLFQAWRTALQQHLRGVLSVSGAGFVRYAYGVPFAFAMVAGYFGWKGLALPMLTPTFLTVAAAAGLAQILGTVCLILSFGYRGFVVGTAFSKTEALLAAIAAAMFFGEHLPTLAWIGITIGVGGIVVLSLSDQRMRWRDILKGATQPAALFGLSAAALFALTGLLVQRATVEVDLTDRPAAALITLAVVMSSQTLLHGAWIAWREPATLRAVGGNWRNAALVGLLSASGSACWFTGFATAPVALVRIVGQVEVFFTIGFAHLYLKERLKPREIAGLMLIAFGVILAVAGNGW